jgi:hypothetical protein
LFSFLNIQGDFMTVTFSQNPDDFILDAARRANGVIPKDAPVMVFSASVGGGKPSRGVASPRFSLDHPAADDMHHGEFEPQRLRY